MHILFEKNVFVKPTNKLLAPSERTCGLIESMKMAFISLAQIWNARYNCASEWAWTFSNPNSRIFLDKK